MGRRYQERWIFPTTQPEVRQAVEVALFEAGLLIKPNPTETKVEASQSMSTFSWGERISLTMGTSPGGGTQVLAESKLVFGFIDWGRNQQNIEAIFTSLDSRVGPGQKAQVDP